MLPTLLVSLNAFMFYIFIHRMLECGYVGTEHVTHSATVGAKVGEVICVCRFSFVVCLSRVYTEPFLDAVSCFHANLIGSSRNESAMETPCDCGSGTRATGSVRSLTGATMHTINI